MTTGLLIGYFEPLHLGHLQDINVAAGQVDTLHIVVLERDDGSSAFAVSIEDKARAVQVACQHFGFVKVHTAKTLGIDVRSCCYDEVDTPLTFDVLRQLIHHLKLDDAVVFYQHDTQAPLDETAYSDQSAIDLASLHYKIKTLPQTAFDSKTIYDNPLVNFHSIAPSARINYTKTICIVGGESSGKTTLVHKLANHYGATVALEMGRLYVHSDLGGTEVGLQLSDYALIAARHANAIHQATTMATAPVTFVDTDFATTQAFCEEYEGHTDDVVAAFAMTNRMDLTIMLDNNVQWVADGMRQLGSDQDRTRFENRLLLMFDRYDITPQMITHDDYHERYLQALTIVDGFLSQLLSHKVNS
ncbi:multifunctional transcriptional regulator/nicotinamide-nucleotide adenylyltransferase/ribosylnicotinamide kinase NadR [Moraxella nasovis]|uniref:multifunctional transcriptional regulator/nicotinamide-nucleotide adenylyltransferase/ribosylnicotinamide kinase NadR n=1 Tax=Moraxella nasovis TaxID=2904121 RepID=UPI001F61F31C|nr:multifunctional transcriptional regulator/nicotinamide-nucleotide adenylyltransferase/ribosylnicotinamide kinase NadR [Moraxella nasovis]UNU74028.1 multifunctional transcriptional regulator/nicotinamide-nucleotide adenylyltransferase/ribosylnicotinamide kinase NadR [Moraxella nasovis]